MFKHYLTSAFRYFNMHRTTTFVNVLCLSVGLIAFAVTYGFSLYVSQGDRYHEKADRTYSLMQKTVHMGESRGFMPLSRFDAAPTIAGHFGELDLVARLSNVYELVISIGPRSQFSRGSFADAELLSVFDFDFLAGDRRAALREPNSVVVREELARQLWGRIDVIGETLRLNNEVSLRVSGVMRKPREPSHLDDATFGGRSDFSMLISMNVMEVVKGDRNKYWFKTYLVMPEKRNDYISVVQKGLATFGGRYFAQESGEMFFALRPVSEFRQIFLDRGFVSRFGVSYVFGILAVGVLVMLVACTNYAILAGAQTTSRLNELAMRRVMGASRMQIALQSMVEALLMTLAAGAIALLSIPFVGLALKNVLAVDIRPALLQSVAFPWICALAIGCTALIASVYPAFLVARVRPARALQGKKGARTRQPVIHVLVVAQFAVAAFLLVFGSLMRTQNETLWEVASRLQSGPVIRIDNNLNEAKVRPSIIKAELRKHPEIIAVTGISGAPGVDIGDNYGFIMSAPEAGARRRLTFRHVVDEEFFAAMDIEILAGRNFSESVGDDFAVMKDGQRFGNAIIDRTLSSQLGWTNPNEAIGRQIYLPISADNNASGKPVTVIGVVEDRTIMPFAVLGTTSTSYAFDDDAASNLLVKVREERVEEGVRALEQVWASMNPAQPLKRRFLDEQYEKFYRDVATTSAGSSFMGALSMLVAAMGLLAIATHSISQRTFEIGVRRVLGASVRQVLTLLLKDFSKPVLIANVVVLPLAVLAISNYRQGFIEQAPIAPMPFIVSLLTCLLIAWVTVIWQSLKVSRMNPASVLRHE